MTGIHKPNISVVIPVYGCDQMLEELYDRLTLTLKSIVDEYEIIFVDDCGTANSWKIIKNIANRDNFVKGLKLSRNFGQHPAITAGLKESIGSWVVVMDCDLQDSPEEIVTLYKSAKEDVDIVFAQRRHRQDSLVKKNLSLLFYKLLGYLTETKIDASVANFGMYRRKVIDAVLSMKEVHKYFPVMVRWVGFPSISVKVAHANRAYGDTSYTIRDLVKLSIGIMLSFSDKPLRLIVKLGYLVSFISSIYAASIIIDAIVYGHSVAGWSSIMVSLWFIAGILMSIMGLVGLYVGKIFDETKSRPIYIVEDQV
jgi:polyisoprenyl-phosphate glycosyltransferase